MKGATEDLSMTAIAVVAIAAIGIVFTTLIWPAIKSNITRSTKCSQAFNCTGTGDMLTCQYCPDDDCSSPEDVQCPAKD